MVVDLPACGGPMTVHTHPAAKNLCCPFVLHRGARPCTGIPSGSTRQCLKAIAVVCGQIGRGDRRHTEQDVATIQLTRARCQLPRKPCGRHVARESKAIPATCSDWGKRH
jgi:hypothetical protein